MADLLQNFIPSGWSTTLTANGTSQPVELPARAADEGFVFIVKGAVDIAIEWGDDTVEADAATSYCVFARFKEGLSPPNGATHVALVTAGTDSVVQIFMGRGA